MANSSFPTSQYASEQFVESCGALLFDLSADPLKVCLLHFHSKNEWFFPKGRRNTGESRQAAALREVEEETGYSCKIHPIAMPTRSPSVNDPPDAPDEARQQQNLSEPFMLTIREIDRKSDVKLIWWYIAVLDATRPHSTSETQFKAQFFSLDDALNRLTFQLDRDILQRAIELLQPLESNQRGR